MRLEETPISSEVVYEGKIFYVEKRMVRLPNGKEARRDIVVNPNATAIVALDDEDRVIMVKQYRESAGRIMLEIPAGKMDPGEDPETCAIRELREETGYRAKSLTKLMGMRVSPGFSSEIIYLFVARDLDLGEVDPDEDEFVEVVKIPLKELVEMIMRGEIEDGKTIAGILAVNHMKKG